MTVFEAKLEAVFSEDVFSEAGRLHGPRHLGRPYGHRGGRANGPNPISVPAPASVSAAALNLRTNFDDTVLAMADVEGVSTGPYDDARAGTWLNAQAENKPGTALAAAQKLKQLLRLTPGQHAAVDDPAHQIAAHRQAGESGTFGQWGERRSDGTGGATMAAVIRGSTSNRWLVYLDGSIAFDSAHAASGVAIARAEKLGFKVR